MAKRITPKLKKSMSHGHFSYFARTQKTEITSTKEDGSGFDLVRSLPIPVLDFSMRFVALEYYGAPAPAFYWLPLLIDVIFAPGDYIFDKASILCDSCFNIADVFFTNINDSTEHYLG
jgi:hypothetical protein